MQVVADSELALRRSCKVETRLDPGRYTVIPYTSGTKLHLHGQVSRAPKHNIAMPMSKQLAARHCTGWV